ncbi:MAG TPA: sulfite exporter TauE/SafE family protein [Dehalococcoidia bacterium]|jgi:hypothetical protein|nr:sulfite exporter TauE/SafE family protein [Dehalococcoidia bacterium]
MDWLEVFGLLAAAFAGGAVNAVAGGGTLIAFPALVAAGYPARTANVTNTAALWTGYLGGSIGYRRELGEQGTRIARLLAPSLLGAIGGAALLLGTPEDAFEVIAPFLILFATLLLAFQERLSAFAASHQLAAEGGNNVPMVLYVTIFLSAIYGAYFGAGLGILTFAFLTIFAPGDAQHSNALKVFLSLVVNGFALVCFALFGPVQWGPAAVMAGGSLVGGYLGAGVARRLGAERLRLAVIALGVVIAVVLFVRAV